MHSNILLHRANLSGRYTATAACLYVGELLVIIRRRRRCMMGHYYTPATGMYAV